MTRPESSLRAYDRVADRIRAHRQVDSRPAVVVEGGSDERLVAAVLPEGAVVIFRGGSRPEVLLAAAAAPKLGLDRIACVLDRDFDQEVEAAETAGLPVVAYDGGDLEDMLLRSPAARRTICEFASEQKLEALGGCEDLLTRAKDCVRPVSALRTANAAHGWGLAFDDVDLTKKISKDDLSLKLRSYCQALHATTDANVELDAVVLAATQIAVPECPRTGGFRYRGRDVLAAVGVALRRLAATLKQEQSQPDVLAAALRAAADRDWLRSTAWFDRLLSLLELRVATE